MSQNAALSASAARPRHCRPRPDSAGTIRRREQPGPSPGRPRGARGDPAPRALAGDPHRSTTPTTCAPTPTAQGRRPPGLVGLGRLDPDRALLRDWLRAGDRVSRQAARLARSSTPSSTCSATSTARYLTTLRAFGGLQAYPSRTKDPDPVDFSTGSVGLGAAAPAVRRAGRPLRRTRTSAPTADPTRASSPWSATPSWTRATSGKPSATRSAARAWATCCGSSTSTARAWTASSPASASRSWRRCSRRIGWQVLEAKYGRRLQAAFERPAARRCASASTRCPTRSTRPDPPARRRAREQLFCAARRRDGVGIARSPRSPTTSCPALLADLGGHDLAELLDGLRTTADADAGPARRVLFAYTIKGWGLPFAGDPLNHSALLDDQQIDDAARRAGHRRRRRVGRFAPDTPAGPAVRRPPPSACAARRAAAPPLLAPDSARPRIDGRRHRADLHPGGVRPHRWPSWPRIAGRWRATSSPPRPTWPSRPTWAAGSTRSASTRRGPAPTTSRGGRACCAGSRARPASTSSSASREMNLFMLLGQLGLSTSWRPAAAAGRHGLRPVRLPRPGRADLRPLLRRAVRLRRHALRASRWRPRAARTSRRSPPRSASSCRT